MADCSKGGIRPPETHDHRQWTAEYIRSLAAWMMTTGDGGGWNQQQAGCGQFLLNLPSIPELLQAALPKKNDYGPQLRTSGGVVAAQRVEHWTCDQQVAGSNPTRGNAA